VGAFDPFNVENGEDVAHALVTRIGRGVVWRVAAALAAGIEEDEAIGITQSLNVASVVAAPVFETSKKADVEDQRRPAALDLIVNADAIVGGVGHGPSSFRRRHRPVRFAPTFVVVGARPRRALAKRRAASSAQLARCKKPPVLDAL
jgi:hypothetical protein